MFLIVMKPFSWLVSESMVIVIDELRLDFGFGLISRLPGDS